MKNKLKYSRLLKKAHESQEYWTESSILDFTEELSRLMDVKKVSRSDLAEKIGSSPAYITKVLRGNVNFTLSSMSKLALALDSVVHIHLSDKDAVVNWRDISNNYSTKWSDVENYPNANLVNFGATQGQAYSKDKVKPVALNEYNDTEWVGVR